MKQWKALVGTVALATIGAGAPALADLTAPQVWEKWRAQAESVGQTITARSETLDGNILRLTGVQTTMRTPEGTVTGLLERVDLRERPNGTVAIALSPDYVVSMDVLGAGGAPSGMSVIVSHEGLVITASGDPETIAYDYIANSLTVSLAGLYAEGAPDDLTLEIALSGIGGSHLVSGTDIPALDGRIEAAEASLDLSGTDPATGERFELAGAFEDLSAGSDSMLAMTDSDNMAAMLAAGFVFASDVTHGPGGYILSRDAGQGPTTVSVTMAAGTYATRLDARGIALTLGASDIAASVSGAEVPFPELTLGAKSSRIALDLPVQASDLAEDFSAEVALEGLTVSDILWQILDPGASLPRDPASLVLALGGQARWFHDIMDPAVQAGVPDGPPGEVKSLNLRDLRISVAGAELTGMGGFTFDNDDLATFDGLPRPEGAIDLQLVGGQTLLGKLVTLGLVPQDQAMGARMMLGIFARPGRGDDTLVSRIEVAPDGAVRANGQRLR